MVKTIKKHKELIYFSSFNILDKFLIFIMPIAILFFFDDKNLYNDIEYLFSISSILIIFLDFGLKSYLFYGYKISDSKSYFLKTSRVYFNYLIYFYSLFFLFSSILFFIYSFNSIYLYLFIFLRALYMLIVGFYTYYFRLIDKPTQIYFYSVIVSLLSLCILGVLYYLNIDINLLYIFVIQIFIILYIIVYWHKNFKSIYFIDFFKQVFISIKYSYPIMINLIMMTLINHFGKIYSYNMLDADAMMEISLIQRVSLILILIHGSLLGFYSKKLFISNKIDDHKNIFFQYSLLILSMFLLIFLSMIISTQLELIQINIYTAIFFLTGTISWVYTAYFELYFNRINQNKYLPIITLVSFLVYSILFLLSDNIDILQLSIIYMISMFTGLLCSFYFLSKLRGDFNVS